MNIHNLKPNRLAYLVMNLKSLIWVSLIAFALIILFLAVPEASIVSLFIFVVWGIFSGLTVGFEYSKYLKENYSFSSSKFVAKKGSIFSDSSTELKPENITQVLVFSSFLQRWLFDTGTVVVKAAGSSGDEVVMNNIEAPETVYGQVIETMEQAGFVLDEKKPIASFRPDLAGVLLGSVNSIFWYIFGLVASGIYLIESVADGMMLVSTESVFNTVFASFVFLGIAFNCLKLVIDLIHEIKSEYILYSDKVVFEQNWLNRFSDLIPLENVSDSETNQTFLQRIIGVSHLTISCQGGENEIVLSNLRKSQEFKVLLKEATTKAENNLNKSVKKSINRNKESTSEETLVESKKTDSSTSSKLTKSFGNSFTQSLDMDWKRVIGGDIFWMILVYGFVFIIFVPIVLLSEGNLLGILFFIALVFIISLILIILPRLIQTLCTSFYINEKSFAQEFVFLTTRKKEFSLEKVTGIEITRNWFDLAFKTCSINIQSIGSSTNIRFTSVAFEPNLIDQILRKIGITKQKLESEYKADFGFENFFKKNLFVWISFFVLWLLSSPIALISLSTFAIITITILLTISLIFGVQYLYYKDHKLSLYSNFVEFREGLITKKQTFTTYYNVKNMISSLYPFSDHGSLTVDVAGERAGVANSGDGSIAIMPFAFTLKYYQGPRILHNKLENILLKHPFLQDSKQQLAVNNDFEFSMQENDYKPSIGIYIFYLIVFSVLIFPLLILLPFTCYCLIYWFKKVSYVVGSDRVESYSGVFFRMINTVQYNRIDHVTKHQGFIQKIFNVADLEIYTTGSSRAELVFRNVKDFDKLFKELENKY